MPIWSKEPLPAPSCRVPPLRVELKPPGFQAGVQTSPTPERHLSLSSSDSRMASSCIPPCISAWQFLQTGTHLFHASSTSVAHFRRKPISDIPNFFSDGTTWWKSMAPTYLSYPHTQHLPPSSLNSFSFRSCLADFCQAFIPGFLGCRVFGFSSFFVFPLPNGEQIKQYFLRWRFLVLPSTSILAANLSPHNWHVLLMPYQSSSDARIC